MILEGLDLLMDLITRSASIVALTGAGISTNAGIADFRGPKGFYTRKDIPTDKIFDIVHFRREPEIFYTYIGELVDSFIDAKPTKGHLFLKKLEDLGRLTSVITQNIDGLHHKAGNQNIIDVHGNFNFFNCMDCGDREDWDEDLRTAIREKRVARCKKCGGVMKPNVVFFGEPVHDLEVALTEVQRSDLMICLGTSLTVYPVSELPSYLPDRSKLAIVNQTETPMDYKARVVLHDDIDQIVTKLGFI